MSNIKTKTETKKIAVLDYGNSGNPAIEVTRHDNGSVEIRLFDTAGKYKFGVRNIFKEDWMDLSATLWPEEVAYQFKDTDGD